MEITTQSFNELVQKVNEFEIAENYFSDILNSQALVFSLIVLAALTIIIGLYFLFIPKITGAQIERESEEIREETERKLKKEIRESFKNFAKEQKKEFSEFDNRMIATMHQYGDDIIGLRGEIFRQFGQFYDSKDLYKTAFIWWIRAAGECASISTAELGVRISLRGAERSLKKIKYPDFSSDNIGEYQRIFNKIDDKLFELEKKALKKAFEELMNKRNKQK